MPNSRLFLPVRAALWLPLVLLVGLCIAFVASLDFSPRNVLPSALINKPLPAFSVAPLEGNSLLTEVDLPERAFLLNVWATWCLPCREEHPILMDIADEGLPIVGLNYKDDPNKAVSWLNSIGNPYEVNLTDPAGSLGIEFGVYGVPSTFFVDSDLVIRYKHVGPISAAQWRKELKPIFTSLRGSDASA